MAVNYESLIIKKCLCSSWCMDNYKYPNPSHFSSDHIVFMGFITLTFDAQGISPYGKPIFLALFC